MKKQGKWTNSVFILYINIILTSVRIVMNLNPSLSQDKKKQIAKKRGRYTKRNWNGTYIKPSQLNEKYMERTPAARLTTLIATMC